MYFLNDEPVTKHPFTELDNLCVLASTLLGQEPEPVQVEPNDESRHFFLTDGWVEGDNDGVRINVSMPGVQRKGIEVYTINNIVVLRGKGIYEAPVDGEIDERTDLTPETAPEVSVPSDDSEPKNVEYYRAVRLPMALLGDSIEVEMGENDTVRVSIAWDMSSQQLMPHNRMPAQSSSLNSSDDLF